jgi:hypothetical protein
MTTESTLPAVPSTASDHSPDATDGPSSSHHGRQAPDPKRIAYSREDRDYWAYYDDEFIGAYPNHLAAERALDDHALYLAEQGLTVFARPAELVEPVYVAPLLLTCASCHTPKPLTAFINVDQEVVCDACLAEDARPGGGAESLPETIALALTGTADPRCGCGAPAFVSHDSHLYCQALWQQGACVPPFTDVCLSCGDPCLDSTCAACHEAGEDLSPPAEPAAAPTAALLSTDQCKVGEALAWEFGADPVGFLAQLETFTDRARHAVAAAMAAYTEKTVGDVIEFWGESRERAVALGMIS